MYAGNGMMQNGGKCINAPAEHSLIFGVNDAEPTCFECSNRRMAIVTSYLFVGCYDKGV